MLKILKTGARFVVLSFAGQSAYQNQQVIQYYVNHQLLAETDKVIVYLDGLKPETSYQLEAVCEQKVLAAVEFQTQYESVTLDVKDFMARGDGVANDTGFIQAAILACPPKGRVLISKGIYKISPLFLKSDINLEIAAGAVLMADNDWRNFPVLPGYTESYDEKDFYNLCNWEGNPLNCYASLITGLNVQNVTIYGQGEINGNASINDWWDPGIKYREPFRPRMIFLNECRNIDIMGVSIYNSPSWTIHPYRSHKIDIMGITIVNPHDSPNTDGIDPESCKDMNIFGVFFDLGDDCIAIKSSKIFMANKKYMPTSDIRIEHCYMKNGHGAVTIGSEIAAGCHHIYVRHCIFENTDRGLRIKTRRGRGSKSIIDQIYFEDILMIGVKTAFVANCFYFCDPDGKSDYVQNQDAMPKDERTPGIHYLEFKNITCRDTRVCAAYLHGLPENPIQQVMFDNVLIEMSASGQPDYPAMMLNIEKMKQNHAVFKNIDVLTLKNFQVLNSKNEMRMERIGQVQ